MTVGPGPLVFGVQPEATSFCRKCVRAPSSSRRTSSFGFRRLSASSFPRSPMMYRSVSAPRSSRGSSLSVSLTQRRYFSVSAISSGVGISMSGTSSRSSSGWYVLLAVTRDNQRAYVGEPYSTSKRMKARTRVMRVDYDEACRRACCLRIPSGGHAFSSASRLHFITFSPR